MKNSITFRRGLGALTGLALLLAGVAGCNKETAPGPSDQPITLGSDKAGHELFSMVNFTGACKFNVQLGCNGCYGYLENNSVPGFQTMRWVTQTATQINVEGYFDPGCQNTITCPFLKAPGAGGPVYYIIPNQGPAVNKRCLKLQVKNGTVPGWLTPAFTYNVTANSWTIQAFAAPYFTASQVTVLPQSNCCVFC